MGARSSVSRGGDLAAYAGAGTTDPDEDALEEYDPKEAAAREQLALQQTVAAMRTEKSWLHREVEELTRRYEGLSVQLSQLSYEDDVQRERDVGMVAMREQTALLEELEHGVEETETYERTLRFMLERGQKEKLTYMATLKAFEDALRVHRQELALQQEVRRAVYKSRNAETRELARMQADAKKQL
jgi:predicted RNase H-like nuclease (RuvC/YqgF family)